MLEKADKSTCYQHPSSPIFARQLGLCDSSGIPLGIVFALPELDYLKASLNYVKLVCCALYGASGVLAAGSYLKDLSTPPASPYGDGAVVGLLAGSFFSVADTFTRMLMRLSGYSEQTLAYMDAMGTERH